MIPLTETQKGEIALMEGRRMRLLDHPEIKPLIEIVAEGVKAEQGRDMSLYEKMCVAQCMQNAREDALARRNSKLFEATTEDSISFLGIQLPVIAALLPSLVLNQIATVQPLDRRIAAVFFLDVVAASNKGEIRATDTLISAKTGVNPKRGGRRYGMAAVSRESIGIGDSTMTDKTETNPLGPTALLANAIVERETSAGVVTIIATCTSAGVISSAAGAAVTVSGTLNTVGQYSITVSGANSDDTILLSYWYQYDQPVDATGAKSGVSGVDVRVQQETVTAEDFPLRTQYSVGASIDLQKAHGINLEDEMIKYVGNMAKFAIDQRGLDMITDAAGNVGAATAPTNWSGAIHSGQAWALHCREFTDRLIEGSNNIFKKTLRGVGNVCVCGNNVARVLRQLLPGFGLEGAFKPSFNWEKELPTGPIVIGNVTSVNNMIVVQNPFMDDNTYVELYKGDNFLYSSFIYAPYIPLFATPTLITSDLYAQKGFLSSAGFKVVNYGLFTKGTISGVGTIA
jgi:hypothetical protein